MREPAPVTRAKALLQHVRLLGGPLEEFCVSVTTEEGFELLQWLREESTEATLNFEVFDRDVERAKKRGDPFDVLENFRLYGLPIAPRGRLT